jgi:hypothetical protein
VIICGNETDLLAVVALDDAESLAQSKGTSVFLTSAANGEGINGAFQVIAQAVVGSTLPFGVDEVRIVLSHLSYHKSHPLPFGDDVVTDRGLQHMQSTHEHERIDFTICGMDPFARFVRSITDQ